MLIREPEAFMIHDVLLKASTVSGLQGFRICFERRGVSQLEGSQYVVYL